MLKQYSIPNGDNNGGARGRKRDNLCKEHGRFIDVNSFFSLTRVALSTLRHCCFCWLINEGIDKAIVNWNVHEKKASRGDIDNGNSSGLH